MNRAHKSRGRLCYLAKRANKQQCTPYERGGCNQNHCLLFAVKLRRPAKVYGFAQAEEHKYYVPRDFHMPCPLSCLQQNQRARKKCARDKTDSTHAAVLTAITPSNNSNRHSTAPPVTTFIPSADARIDDDTKLGTWRQLALSLARSLGTRCLRRFDPTNEDVG